MNKAAEKGKVPPYGTFCHLCSSQYHYVQMFAANLTRGGLHRSTKEAPGGMWKTRRHVHPEPINLFASQNASILHKDVSNSCSQKNTVLCHVCLSSFD